MPESIGCAACAIWIHVRPSMIFLEVIDRASPPPAPPAFNVTLAVESMENQNILKTLGIAKKTRML